jgi:hypothetical protein
MAEYPEVRAGGGDFRSLVKVDGVLAVSVREPIA